MTGTMTPRQFEQWKALEFDPDTLRRLGDVLQAAVRVQTGELLLKAKRPPTAVEWMGWTDGERALVSMVRTGCLGWTPYDMATA